MNFKVICILIFTLVVITTAKPSKKKNKKYGSEETSVEEYSTDWNEENLRKKLNQYYGHHSHKYTRYNRKHDIQSYEDEKYTECKGKSRRTKKCLERDNDSSNSYDSEDSTEKDHHYYSKKKRRNESNESDSHEKKKHKNRLKRLHHSKNYSGSDEKHKPKCHHHSESDESGSHEKHKPKRHHHSKSNESDSHSGSDESGSNKKHKSKHHHRSGSDESGSQEKHKQKPKRKCYYDSNKRKYKNRRLRCPDDISKENSNPKPNFYPENPDNYWNITPYYPCHPYDYNCKAQYSFPYFTTTNEPVETTIKTTIKPTVTDPTKRSTTSKPKTSTPTSHASSTTSKGVIYSEDGTNNGSEEDYIDIRYIRENQKRKN